MSQIQISINPDYYDLVPRPSKQEYQTLRESIQQDGLREPIIINNEGVVLDGHTRFEICQNLGITPETRVKQFDTEVEERLYVIQANLIRRQLNAFQKIELCYNDYKQLKKEAKSHIGDRKNKTKFGSVNRLLGYRLGLNHHTILYGIRLIENANKQTIRMLRSGSITINKAYNQLQLKDRKKIVKRTYPSVQTLLNFYKNNPKYYDDFKWFVDKFDELVTSKMNNFEGIIFQRCSINKHHECKNTTQQCECPCHRGILQ